MSSAGLGQLPILALILFLPWFLILGTLFLAYPRQPRDRTRWAFDITALLAAVVLFVVSAHWAFGQADRSHGAMWPQVLATSVGYAVYLTAMSAAWLWRRQWLRRRRKVTVDGI